MENNSEAVVFGDVRKNKRLVIRVSLEEYEGRGFAYLSTWLQPQGEDGEGAYTDKRYGLSLRVWEQLLPLIEAAIAEGQRRWGRR
jgi:hypothetical protein